MADNINSALDKIEKSIKDFFKNDYGYSDSEIKSMYNIQESETDDEISIEISIETDFETASELAHDWSEILVQYGYDAYFDAINAQTFIARIDLNNDELTDEEQSNLESILEFVGIRLDETYGVDFEIDEDLTAYYTYDETLTVLYITRDSSQRAGCTDFRFPRMYLESSNTPPTMQPIVSKLYQACSRHYRG